MKDFIPYETGFPKLLKEKGFAETCLAYYPNTIDGLCFIKNKNRQGEYADVGGFPQKACSAPTYNQVKDWFKDKHHIKIDVCHAESNGTYRITLWRWNFDNQIGKWERFGFISSYEDWYIAANKAIEEALKLI